MTDPRVIAARLTEAQRKVFARMEVREPHPIMPTYYAVTFYGGDIPALEVESLQKLGLMKLPIATGGRGTPTYRGEILPLGLAVRRILQEQTDDR